MLNQCMARNRNLPREEIQTLRTDFKHRLQLAHQLFGRDAFQLPGEDGRLSRPLFDAILVSLDQLWERRTELVAAKASIKRNFPRLFEDKKTYRLIVGKTPRALANYDLRRVEKEPVHDGLECVVRSHKHVGLIPDAGFLQLEGNAVPDVVADIFFVEQNLMHGST